MAVLLINPFYLGDSVLLEPIGSQLHNIVKDDIYIISNYSELFVGHPTIKASNNTEIENVQHIIDFGTAIRSLEDRKIELGRIKKFIANKIPTLKNNGWFIEQYSEIHPGKIKSMYEMAGMDEKYIIPPKLYLTDEESKLSQSLKELFQGFKIGVVLNSRHSNKDYPHTNLLIKQLLKRGHNVFVIGLDISPKLQSHQYNLYNLINLPLRKVMTWISALDMVIGPDTGMMHVAGALDIKTVVITRKIWADIHSHYPRCTMLYSDRDDPESIKKIPVQKVLDVVDRETSIYTHSQTIAKIQKSEDDIVLFRLDGLGGSLTITDQVKKIYDQTGIKSTLVVRNYKDIFKDNPYVKNVIEVGYVKWGETLIKVLDEFDVVGEIRFGIGKWHQQGKRVFDQDFSGWEGIFDKFPKDYRDLETHGLHHIQLTSKTMMLPYETIDSKVYYYEDIGHFRLPKEYIIVQDGVDAQHKGMRQTKVWYGWDRLVGMIDMPVIQLGTEHDNLVKGVDVDLRGKTKLGELSSLTKEAKAIICTEGGFMHLAYAVDNSNVLVLRGPTRGKLFEYPGQTMVDSYLCDNCWSMTDDWYAECPRDCNAVCMKSITAERVAFNLERILN